MPRPFNPCAPKAPKATELAAERAPTIQKGGVVMVLKGVVVVVYNLEGIWKEKG
jgi:hypothetical protein